MSNALAYTGAPIGYDPTHQTALFSLDFGDVMSADGRAHPLTALTPMTALPSLTDFGVDVAATTVGAVDKTPATPQGAASVPAGSDCSKYTIGSWDWSQCVGAKAQGAISSAVQPSSTSWARLALGVLAILIIAIAVFRIVK